MHVREVNPEVNSTFLQELLSLLSNFGVNPLLSYKLADFTCYTERMKTKVRCKEGALIPGGRDGKGASSQGTRQQISVGLFKYIPSTE
jgi:hypothetical protein